jgi:hypothetical protein
MQAFSLQKCFGYRESRYVCNDAIGKSRRRVSAAKPARCYNDPGYMRRIDELSQPDGSPTAATTWTGELFTFSTAHIP